MNLNGPVILTKPVGDDKLNIHRHPEYDGVYFDVCFSPKTEERHGLVGVSFTLTSEEIRALTPAPAVDAEALGKVVREAWVAYCKETGDTKPSHIAPWEDISEWDREVDRRIGLAVAAALPARPAVVEGERVAAVAKELHEMAQMLARESAERFWPNDCRLTFASQARKLARMAAALTAGAGLEGEQDGHGN